MQTLINWRAVRVGTAIGLCLVFLANEAMAADVTLQWDLPTTDCDGAPQPIADELEIFVSTEPIPAASDNTPTKCERDDQGAPIDVRPAGGGVVLTAQTPNAERGTLDVQLLGGQVYYVRAWLRVGNEWSNLSRQLQMDIPRGALNVPTIIRLGG